MVMSVASLNDTVVIEAKLSHSGIPERMMDCLPAPLRHLGPPVGVNLQVVKEGHRGGDAAARELASPPLVHRLESSSFARCGRFVLDLRLQSTRNRPRGDWCVNWDTYEVSG